MRLFGRKLARNASGGAIALVCAFGVSLAGCATAPSLSSDPGPTSSTHLAPPSYLAKNTAVEPAEPKETPDPLEAMNRKVFEGNQAFNHAIVYPAAKAYREGVPEELRDRINAFTTNLTEPMVFANNVLQLRPDAALTTLARFLTNSTIGIGGLFDVAATVGQEHQTGDFGQTLYVWGVRDTAYLVLPILGPSNVRDAVGIGVEMLVPSATLTKLPTKLATVVEQFNTVDTFGRPVAGLSKVEMLEELEASSLDFYAMLRSMADQKRQSELQQALKESLLTATPTEATPLRPGPAAVDGSEAGGATNVTTVKPKRSVVVGEPKIVQ